MRFKLVANGPKEVTLEVDGKPVDLNQVSGITLRLDPTGIDLFVHYWVEEIEAEGDAEVVAT